MANEHATLVRDAMLNGLDTSGVEYSVVTTAVAAWSPGTELDAIIIFKDGKRVIVKIKEVV